MDNKEAVNVRYKMISEYRNGVLYDTLKSYCPNCGSIVNDPLPGTCKQCGLNLKCKEWIIKR